MQNEEKILHILEGIQSDISELKEDVSELKTDVSGLKADMTEVKADVSGLKEDVSDLKGRMTKVELCLENQVLPGIQLLAEGHESILEQTASKAELEAVKDEIDSFKMAIKIAVQAQEQ